MKVEEEEVCGSRWSLTKKKCENRRSPKRKEVCGIRWSSKRSVWKRMGVKEEVRVLNTHGFQLLS